MPDVTYRRTIWDLHDPYELHTRSTQVDIFHIKILQAYKLSYHIVYLISLTQGHPESCHSMQNLTELL